MASPTNCRKKLVVIGGGAAGYFGAIQAAACGTSALDVVVLEAGRLPLQKVKISGGGRCNVMHDTSKAGWDVEHDALAQTCVAVLACCLVIFVKPVLCLQEA